MELLNLIFRLGVLFAIYSFIWFFIDLVIGVVRAGRQKTLFENYFFKSVKYLFLVNVTFLFSMDMNKSELTPLNVMPTAIILIAYFVGKFQQKQQQAILFGQFMPEKQQNDFHLQSEIVLIVCSGLFFGGLLFFPDFANNGIANWFHDSILDIENTAIIGFIFKVIGFFFLLSMLIKMLNAINYILSGKPLMDIRTSFRSGKSDDDKFDDFEEIN